MIEKQQPEKILIVKLSSLGDVVHSLPVLKVLKEKWPGVRISWVVNSSYTQILRGHPYLDQVIPFDRQKWSKLSHLPGAMVGILALMSSIRRERFDWVLDLQGLFKSGVISYFSGAPYRVGFANSRELSSLFYNQRIDLPSGPMHAVDRYFYLVNSSCHFVATRSMKITPLSSPLNLRGDKGGGSKEAEGPGGGKKGYFQVNPPCPPQAGTTSHENISQWGTSLHPTNCSISGSLEPSAPGTLEPYFRTNSLTGQGHAQPTFLLPDFPGKGPFIQNFFATHKVDEERAKVAVCPSARWQSKRWPVERFGELIRKLTATWWQVLIIGGREDKEIADRLLKADSSGNVISIAGETDLLQLAAVLERVQVLVTNDTGPMHLAAAVGTPVVALFGPTNPQLTGPYGSGHKVLKSSVSCSPCFKKECAYPKCLWQISVDEVYAAILPYL